MNYLELIRLLTPVIVLCTGATICLLLGAGKGSARKWAPHTALLTLAISIVMSCAIYYNWRVGPQLAWSEDLSLHLNAFAFYTGLIGQIVGMLLILIGWNPDAWGGIADDEEPISVTGEFFSMTLFSISGLVLLTLANNLIVLFLALELVSIPTYIMVVLSRQHNQAREAGLKYFFLGAMAAAITVYGFSLLYGLSGTIIITAPDGAAVTTLMDSISPASNLFYLLAFLIILAGLCFKMAAVPLHFYVADVYQGAASTVTALLAFVPKLAGFFALMILLQVLGHPLWLDIAPEAGPHLGNLTGWVLWILAAGTMTVGNVLAGYEALQGINGNIKRILAYSSVAHTGYMLLALLEGTRTADPTLGMTAILFYIAVYAVATLGSFGVIALLERQGDEAQSLGDLRGLAKAHPGLAAALAICLFSLIGMPLTAGFIGKFYVFSALVTDAAIPHRIGLLVVALINAAIAAYYYLRIIAACYLDEGQLQVNLRSPQIRPQLSGIALAGALTIILGIAPSILLDPIKNNTAPADAIMVQQEIVDTPSAEDPAPVTTASQAHLRTDTTN